ncbi:MAG: FKBP-type peptidyl-prolyl cis-trans isomerase, partial [Bacteroidales bacterium]|nr:FKBP-type peptidyl-prolyl cis-trans isomerase [Bacteroidales bacterium]
IFNTTRYYDSTYQHYPERGILGAGHYMSGLEKGLVGMQKNEEAEILLTGEQAYGNAGMGILPTYSSVKFEIKMLNVVKNH